MSPGIDGCSCCVPVFSLPFMPGRKDDTRTCGGVSQRMTCCPVEKIGNRHMRQVGSGKCRSPGFGCLVLVSGDASHRMHLADCKLGGFWVIREGKRCRRRSNQPICPEPLTVEHFELRQNGGPLWPYFVGALQFMVSILAELGNGIKACLTRSGAAGILPDFKFDARVGH